MTPTFPNILHKKNSTDRLVLARKISHLSQTLKGSPVALLGLFCSEMNNIPFTGIDGHTFTASHPLSRQDSGQE
jgi:hypothetical protein